MPKGKVPADVERYVQEHKDQGMDEGKAWAIAWSRYCEYKNPGSDHCRKDSYFEGRKAGSDPLRILNTTLHAKSGGDVGLSVTGYDPSTSTYLGSLVRWTSGQPLGVSERSYPIQDIKRVFDVRSGRYGSDKVLFKELVRVAKQQKGVRSHLLPLLHRYIKNP